MSSVASSSPRERILRAAFTLLETGGLEAVSTRAVSAAAAVQAPTIYRQFGDMQGLLNAVASAGFAAYLQAKAERPRVSDPVDDLREGWNLHVEFGLAHPHLYILMYGTLRQGASSPAAAKATTILRSMVQRVAEAGRLAVSVDRAAAMISAAGEGVTLRLLSDPVKDHGLSELMLAAVLRAVLTPEPQSVGGGFGGDGLGGGPGQQAQATAHAVSLAALLPDLPARFSEAEHTLLLEWLHRLM